jgi:hypothetical protein
LPAPRNRKTAQSRSHPARDTASPYVNNRPLLVAGKPEVREYRATYVLGDAEIGNPSDEAVITATP